MYVKQLLLSYRSGFLMTHVFPHSKMGSYV
jgi:hypothetical protein